MVRFLQGIHYVVFTLPDTKTDTETNEKMGCIRLCGGVNTAQTNDKTDSHWVLCTGSLSICLGFSIGLLQCEWTINRNRSRTT